jgi:protein SCO1/2
MTLRRHGGAGFSLQQRLEPLSGPGLKSRLQAKACSTILAFVLAIPVFAGGGYESQVGGPKAGDPPILPPGVTPRELEGVGVDEHLARNIDLSLTFTGEDGNPVPLKAFFQKGRPVILDLIYYKCPNLCNLVLNGQTEAMKEIGWTPGKEYDVVTISINPKETPDIAREKKGTYLNDFGKPAPGWYFLTDHDGNAKKLAEEIGYHYRYDQRQDQYAHPATIMILTPDGKIARYLYGVRFRSKDVRFALAEASEGRMTLTLEKILLLCYHYDPQANRYVLFAMNFMRIGGALSALLLAAYIWHMFRTEKSRPNNIGIHREGIV